MTYFGVLLAFIAPPLVVLAGLTLYEARRGRRLPPAFRTWPAAAILWGHVAIALIYTTPWDNYLVANRVWWYDPELVTGVVLGWVPIEEYTFFVVQTLMTGLWVLAWMRRLPLPAAPFRPHRRARWISALLAAALWAACVAAFVAGWERGLYMALLLGWFLPPIILQLGFGADILWHYRNHVLIALIVPTVYLCIVDAIAIGSGTWTISPDYTLGVEVAGVLPLEEITFFAITNVLISFGMVLMLARESHVRARTRVVRDQAPGGAD
ncbi:MAG: lycopene cyclase domain-containing protein [Anaerolineae bacterium]|nr:lycopene cyclase domain-containing protein [Anaerolineae bacterium]